APWCVYGATVAFLGDVGGGMEHIERAVALFDPRQHLEGFRFGPSPGAIACTTAALLQWLRGRPDRSTQLSERAIGLPHGHRPTPPSSRSARSGSRRSSTIRTARRTSSSTRPCSTSGGEGSPSCTNTRV